MHILQLANLILTTLKAIARFVRWRDWGPGKVTILSSLSFYIALAYDLPFKTFASVFVLFLVFASAQSALGFVINEWGDRRLDRKQGKPNVFNERSPRAGRMGLILTLGVAILVGMPFVSHPYFLQLWFAWMLAAMAYSLAPIRLKTRGAPGLIVSFIAQWSLPVFIAFAVFERLGRIDMWLFALALTLSGATLEIAHQRDDRTRDTYTLAGTFAVRQPPRQLDRIFAIAILLDKLSIGLIVIAISWSMLNLSTVWALGFAGIIVLIYAALLGATLPSALRAIGGDVIQDPYYSTGYSAVRLLHQTFPNLIIPAILTLAATLREPVYIILFILFIVWRVVLGNANWWSPIRIFAQWFAR